MIFTDTEFPFLLKGTDGRLYYSNLVPPFLIFPNKPLDKVIINGKHLTTRELKEYINNVTVLGGGAYD